MNKIDEKIDKFWKYVTITGLHECWNWCGPVASNKGVKDKRYGSFWWDGKKYLAHQISYMLNNGLSKPVSEIIKRSCNNIKCVNPRHLYIVKRVLNQKEKTQISGKLKDKVSIVRQLLIEGFTCTEIANIFNVTIGVICGINNNKYYKNDDWKPIKYKTRLSKDKKAEILNLLLTDITQAEIAEKFKCNQSTISGIKNELC